MIMRQFVVRKLYIVINYTYLIFNCYLFVFHGNNRNLMPRCLVYHTSIIHLVPLLFVLQRGTISTAGV